eukprot:scaffold211100_cov53-Cyclotella_meneghiniana.AAC.1
MALMPVTGSAMRRWWLVSCALCVVRGLRLSRWCTLIGRARFGSLWFVGVVAARVSRTLYLKTTTATRLRSSPSTAVAELIGRSSYRSDPLYSLPYLPG